MSNFVKNISQLVSKDYKNDDMKRLQKFEGCDYKDNTTNVLNKLFSYEMMSEINLKDNEKKIDITDTDIFNIIVAAVTKMYQCTKQDIRKIAFQMHHHVSDAQKRIVKQRRKKVTEEKIGLENKGSNED